MSHHHPHEVLLGLVLHRGRSVGAGLCPAGCGAAPLVAGVHVRFIVVAHVQDVFVSLGRRGDPAEADVKGGPVSGPAHHLGFRIPPGHETPF